MDGLARCKSMLPLDDSLWSSLSPKRYAPLYPARLRELAETVASGRYSRDTLGDLCTMCWDWSTFDSTFAAVPHLVHICRNEPPQSAARIDLLAWIGWCVACIHLNRQDGPKQLKQWYDGAVPIARDLIAESLPFAQDSTPSKATSENCWLRLRPVMATPRWRSSCMSCRLAASSVIIVIRSLFHWNRR